MQSWEFTNLLRGLYEYFGKKEPSDQQAKAWFQRVQAIPGQAVKYIGSTLEGRDDLPKNLPRSMWGCYYEWAKDHPQEALTGRTCSDPNCDEGLLHVRREDSPGVWAFRCTVCKRSDSIGIPELTDWTGYHIDRLEDYPKYLVAPPEIPRRKIKTFVSIDDMDRIERELENMRVSNEKMDRHGSVHKPCKGGYFETQSTDQMPSMRTNTNAQR